MSFSSTGSLSSVPNGRIIDFEIAELRTLPFEDSQYLWVRGTLPGNSFEARLAPRIYQNRPDYWGIEIAAVQAHVPHRLAPVGDEPTTFEQSIPLTGITGVRGITVIGANQVKRIDIIGES